MGYLDDLKRQATALRAEQGKQSTLNERNAMLADAACKTAFQYWLQLAEQLNTLKPISKARYALDTRLTLQDLMATDFRVDARRRGTRDKEHYDHAVIQWSIKGPAGMKAEKDFVNDIERLDARLAQAGIRPVTDSLRSPETGKLLSVAYRFDAHIACSILLTPDHANARVVFKAVNLDGLETLVASLPAFEINTARLDELTKWVLGEVHSFLKGATDIRRVAPQ